MSNPHPLEYWKNPRDNNAAENYLDSKKQTQKTDIVYKTIYKYAKKTDSILELGCNVGRNLNRFMEEGYKKVSGVEISEIAIKLGEKHYPELTGKMKLSSIEDCIKDLPVHDIVFTRAVLEHITRESDWIFPEIEKVVGKYLITIEDEKSDGWKHFKRNYQDVFTNLTQIETRRLAEEGMSDFVLRVFENK